MKKLILAALMVVMLAVPCMAEVEPEGLFGVEGTYWTGTATADDNGITSPFVDLGFYGGRIMYFGVGIADPRSSYADLFLFTVINIQEGGGDMFYSATINGILVPFLGIGWGRGTLGDSYAFSANWTKTSDNWTPPSE